MVLLLTRAESGAILNFAVEEYRCDSEEALKEKIRKTVDKAECL